MFFDQWLAGGNPLRLYVKDLTFFGFHNQTPADFTFLKGEQTSLH